MLSGVSRDRPVIVGWSTAPRGQVIEESLGQLPKKLAAGPRVLARTESLRTQSGTKQGGPPHDHWAKLGQLRYTRSQYAFVVIALFSMKFIAPPSRKNSLTPDVAGNISECPGDFVGIRTPPCCNRNLPVMRVGTSRLCQYRSRAMRSAHGRGGRQAQSARPAHYLPGRDPRNRRDVPALWGRHSGAMIWGPRINTARERTFANVWQRRR